MHVDPDQRSAADNYRLLSTLVVPRPIAWLSTGNEDGSVNLAPFSFFNIVSSDPLYVAVSIASRPNGEDKDSARNIKRNHEFVVNLVTEELLDAMNVSGADFLPGESELSAANLNASPAGKIVTPRITEAQASLECRLHSQQALGSYTLFIGEVVLMHIADSLIDERGRFTGFSPIGRMGVPSTYCRTTDRFELPRIGYPQWLAAQAAQKRS
ncbi:MAG: flavin reductase family protein [Steroidobacteraceae bacterium]